MSPPAHGEPLTREMLEEELAIHAMAELREIRKVVESIMRAFPEGVESHRLEHQALLDAAKAEKEFWRDLKSKIVEKSIWGILQILGVLLAAGLAVKFGFSLKG